MDHATTNATKAESASAVLLAKAFAIVLSGAAFGALFVLGTTARSAQGALEADPAATPVETSAPVVPASMATAAPTSFDVAVGAVPSAEDVAAVARARSEGAVAPSTEAEPSSTSGRGSSPLVDATGEARAGAVVMPRVIGMRLSKARRELAALGLRVSAHDPYLDTISRDSMRYYRVSTQSLPVGSSVAPDTQVELGAREIGGYAEGY